MNEIIRKDYLERLDNLKHKQLIKIVTGIRRCGKSTVLEMFRDKLISEGVNENQISKLSKDKEVTITPTTDESLNYTGTVTKIDSVGTYETLILNILGGLLFVLATITSIVIYKHNSKHRMLTI